MRLGILGTWLSACVVFAGCGAAAQLQAAPNASNSLLAAAFVKQVPGTQVKGGAVLAASKKGVSLRPVPDATFGLMVVFKNRSRRQLVLEDVRAVIPRGSFLRPLGADLAPFFQCNPHCSRHYVMRGPYGTERPSAVHVRPTRSAQAQLDFAIARCAALRTAHLTPIRRVIVIYHDQHGATFRESVSLRSSRLDLVRSGQIACHA